jgi:hypothetical protein
VEERTAKPPRDGDDLTGCRSAVFRSEVIDQRASGGDIGFDRAVDYHAIPAAVVVGTSKAQSCLGRIHACIFARVIARTDASNVDRLGVRRCERFDLPKWDYRLFRN